MSIRDYLTEIFPELYAVKTNKRKQILVMASSDSHAEVQVEDDLKSGEKIISIKRVKKK
jgi:hypothetical protein